jgi:hypothetical protein
VGRMELTGDRGSVDGQKGGSARESGQQTNALALGGRNWPCRSTERLANERPERQKERWF